MRITIGAIFENKKCRHTLVIVQPKIKFRLPDAVATSQKKYFLVPGAIFN